MKTGDIHVLGRHGHIQQLQHASTLANVDRADASCSTRRVQLVQTLVAEAADHALSVNQLVYGVNWRDGISGGRVDTGQENPKLDDLRRCFECAQVVRRKIIHGEPPHSKDSDLVSKSTAERSGPRI